MAKCLMVGNCANQIQRQVIRLPYAMRIPRYTKISPPWSLKMTSSPCSRHLFVRQDSLYGTNCKKKNKTILLCKIKYLEQQQTLIHVFCEKSKLKVNQVYCWMLNFHLELSVVEKKLTNQQIFICGKPQQNKSMETGTELGLSQADEHSLINQSRKIWQITGTAQSHV